MDFTTTAMPRPDVYNRCLRSFEKNLIGLSLKDCNLFINIDPLPYNSKSELMEINRLRCGVVGVAESYFKNVFPRLPKVGNYADAYKWIWNNADSEIIFNIEDDWILNRPVNVNHLLKKFENNTLYQVVFRAYNYVYPTCCTSPSLLHRRWYKPIAKGMNKTQNPESQIHKNTDHRFNTFIPNRKTCSSRKLPGKRRKIEKYVYAYPKWRMIPKNIIVEDIGRDWIKNSPYISPVEKYKIKNKEYINFCKVNKIKVHIPKQYKKVNFLSWVIKDDVSPLQWLMEYK